MKLATSAIGSLIPVVTTAEVIGVHSSEGSIIVNSIQAHVCITIDQPDVFFITVPSGSIAQNIAIELFVANNTEAHVVILQASEQDKITINQQSSLGAHSVLHTHIATLGSAACTHSVVNNLNGESGISNVNWLFYGKNAENYTIDSQNVFNARLGGGEMLLKGVVQDNAVVTCNGMINISLQGQGTDTYLTEDVLMLDSTAKINAIPGLEIKTNDVKASHSATVSKVTQQDLFYFAARGINETDARIMFIEGYLDSVIENVPDEQKNVLLEAIANKI